MTAAAVDAIAATVLVSSRSAQAAPSGFANFGNAQDTVNTLAAAGYNVQIYGATAFPLSSCKVLQVEGLNNSNIGSNGKRLDPLSLTPYTSMSLAGEGNSSRRSRG